MRTAAAGGRLGEHDPRRVIEAEDPLERRRALGGAPDERIELRIGEDADRPPGARCAQDEEVGAATGLGGGAGRGSGALRTAARGQREPKRDQRRAHETKLPAARALNKARCAER